MLGSKPIETLIEPNIVLTDDDSLEYKDKQKYISLIGKLIYLTITRCDITFSMGAVS